MGSGGLLLEPPCNGTAAVVYCSYQGDSNMIIPPHPRSVTAASEWMAALDRLKAAEAEVLRAREAVTAACTAYNAARDAEYWAATEEPPACNPTTGVV